MHHRYSQGSNSAVSIANSVQAFITTMDSLKLNMAAVDQVWFTTCNKNLGFVQNFALASVLDLQIYPLMSDLLTNINKVCNATSCSAFFCSIFALLLKQGCGRYSQPLLVMT